MIQNLTERERKLVFALIPVLLIFAVVYFRPEPATSEARILDKAAAIEVAQARLSQARIISAQLPGKQDVKKTLDGAVANWEKRFIVADTPAQAQAQLNQLFRKIARAQGPAVEIRNIDIGTVQPLTSYAEIVLSISFDCQVEGLVNLLTDLASQPELLVWRDLRINSTDSKQKRINVSMTLGALASAKLLPKTAQGGRG